MIVRLLGVFLGDGFLIKLLMLYRFGFFLFLGLIILYLEIFLWGIFIIVNVDVCVLL